MIRTVNKKSLVPLELTSCFSAGDPHIYTFDGDRYDFQGLCKYTMVENLSADDLPAFKVTTKNEVRGTSTDVTYPKYAETEVYGYVIRQDKGNVVMVGIVIWGHTYITIGI